MELTKKNLGKLTKQTMQSTRTNIYEDVVYAIYITKGFKFIGWMAEINEKYYGTQAEMVLPAKQKDDIIDYYLAMDKNAQESIKEIKSNIN